MIISIGGLAEVGIVKDRLPHELPLNAWSDGENVHFQNGYVEKTDGYTRVFTALPLVPKFLLPVPTQSQYYWLAAGDSKVYVFDGGDYVNATRQTASVDVDYTGADANVWTGGLIGGIAVLNNGVDVPQQWATASSGTRLSALSNWPSTVRCKSMRSYKQFLIASNLTKAGVPYANTLKWSHPADPGTVPSSWDETDPTKDAGEYEFADTGDFLVDTVPLRDVNIVYKENTTWMMQFIGGVDIFRFSKLFGNFGLMSPHCAVEFNNGQHLVLTLGDIIVHNGQTWESIAGTRWKKWMSQNINPDALHRNHVVSYNVLEEVWICLATGSSEQANKALVWNWRTNTFGLRNLPRVNYTASGLIVATVSDSWESDSGSWDDDTTTWGNRLYGPSELNLLAAPQELTHLQKIDGAVTEDGTVQTSWIERKSFGIPMLQNQPPDIASVKFLRAIYPRIEGSAGGVVNVEIGTQMQLNDPVVWKPAKPFTIGQSLKVNMITSGRLFSIRFSSNSAINWRLHGYDLDIDFGGEY